MPPTRILFALILTGFYAILSQVLIIREFLVTFSGNELSIGVFLSNWLLLEAIGSYLGGRFTKKIRLPAFAFATLQLLLAVCLPLIIYCTRIFKLNLSTSIGEAIPIPLLFVASMILLIPIALINGAQFSLGCRLLSTYNKDTYSTIGTVYIFEAFGSLVGGVVVTYYCLTHLNIFQSVFLLSILNSISGFLLLKKDDDPYSSFSKYLRILHLLLLFVLAIFYQIGLPTSINIKSRALQWPGYQVVASQNSIYGNSLLLKRDEQFELLSNGVPLLSFPGSNISDIENTAHLPLLFHPEPNSALLVGGGLNGVLKEMIKHPLINIDYAELDPVLSDIILRNIPDFGFDYLSDPRIHLHEVDGRQFLVSNSQRYDVIILNLPDPSTLEINRFYTREFFALCKDRLTSSGVLFFNLPGGASYINAYLMRLNTCLLASVDSVFQYSRIFPFETMMVLASADLRLLDINQDTLSTRMKKRNIATHSLSDRYLLHLFDPRRTEWFTQEKNQMISTTQNLDFNPRAVYYDLLYWNTRLSPGFARIYLWFEKLKFFHLIVIISLLLFTLILLPQSRFEKKLIATGTVITSSGFTGMGLTLIMILSFQALFGYVYFWIGMIVGSFMFGSAIGGIISTRWWIKKDNQHILMLATEISLIGYFLLLLATIVTFNQTDTNMMAIKFIPAFILFMTGLCGFTMGSQFPLAGRMFHQKSHNTTLAAGITYSLDLLGAWFAGMIVSLYMIPLLGMVDTILIFIIIKAGSMLVLLIAGTNQTERVISRMQS